MLSLRQYGVIAMSKTTEWFVGKIRQAINDKSYWRERFWLRLWWCILCRYEETVILFYGWDDCRKDVKVIRAGKKSSIDW